MSIVNENAEFIECEIEPGMFEDEFLVYVDAIDPSSPSSIISVQILVDRDVVEFSGEPERGKRIKGRLQISVADRSQGIATVVLPQPGIPVGDSMIVNEGALI